MLNSSILYRTLIQPTQNLAAHYSLRKLNGYSGSAIRVRRSSDNTEQDIGFSGSVLDTASLTSFVGANDGYVTTWYEQTGFGNDLKRSASTEQPQIVFSGVVQTSSGYPCIFFDGVNDRLIENDAVGPFQDFTTGGLYSAFSVIEPTVINIGTNHVYIHADRATPRFAQIGRISSGNAQFISFNTVGANYTDTDGTSMSINTKYLTSSIRSQSQIEIYTNSTSNGSTSTLGTPRSKSIQLEVGCRLFPSEAFTGNMFEVSIYDTSLDNTRRQNIENEIINYYGI